MSIIRFENVSKTYGTTEAVNNITLSIPKGKIVVFVGSSGSGKTTLLKMINLLIKPSSGTILFNGQDNKTLNVEDLRKQIGYVGQSGGLFPHKNVEANIETTPKLLGWDAQKRLTNTKRLMEDVGLNYETYAKRYPIELSGGQKQRVAIARAMAANPPILLMDEPFSALDPIIRQKLQNDLLQLHHESQITIVFVTHDMDEAFRLGDLIVYMEDGEIVTSKTPLQFLKAPQNETIQILLSFLSNATIQKIKDSEQHV